METADPGKFVIRLSDYGDLKPENVASFSSVSHAAPLARHALFDRFKLYAQQLHRLDAGQVGRQVVGERVQNRFQDCVVGQARSNPLIVIIGRGGK